MGPSPDGDPGEQHGELSAHPFYLGPSWASSACSWDPRFVLFPCPWPQGPGKGKQHQVPGKTASRAQKARLQGRPIPNTKYQLRKHRSQEEFKPQH